MPEKLKSLNPIEISTQERSISINEAARERGDAALIQTIHEVAPGCKTWNVPERLTPEGTLAGEPRLELTGDPEKDYREFIERMFARLKPVFAAVEENEKTGHNPGLLVAEYLMDWKADKSWLKGSDSYCWALPSGSDEARQEFRKMYEGGDYGTVDEKIAIIAHAISFKSTDLGWLISITKRLDAYVEPLLDANDLNAEQIRNLVHAMKQTVDELFLVTGAYGVDIDDVRLLAPAPEGVEVERGRAEGFLLRDRGAKISVRDFRKILEARMEGLTDSQKASFVTDFVKIGFGIRGGEHISNTTIKVYQKGVWDAAQQLNGPNFTTHP